MTRALAATRKEARKQGIDVFCIPLIAPYGVLGTAWQYEGRRLINIFSDQSGVDLAYVLAHEIAHHVLGHFTTKACGSTLHMEFEAEMWAIRFLGPHLSYDDGARIEELARDYLRPALQRRLRADEYQIMDHDVAIWAGCDVPWARVDT